MQIKCFSSTFPDRLGIWKFFFLGEGKNGVPGPFGANERSNNELIQKLKNSLDHQILTPDVRRSATWATAEAFDILSREDHIHTSTRDRLQVSCKTTVNGYFCKQFSVNKIT